MCKIYILCLLVIKQIWTRNRARFTTNRRDCLPQGVQGSSVDHPDSYLISAGRNVTATYSWQLTALNWLMENLIKLHKGNISRKSISNDVISKNNILFWNMEHLKINVCINNNVTNHKIFYQSLLPSRIFKLLDIYYHCPAVTYVYKDRGKVSPLQAWFGPEGG